MTKWLYPEHLTANEYYYNDTELSTLDPRLSRCCRELEELRIRKFYPRRVHHITTLVGFIVTDIFTPSGEELDLVTRSIHSLYRKVVTLGPDLHPNTIALLFHCVYSAFRPLDEIPFGVDGGEFEDDKSDYNESDDEDV